jgi:hypothetical protein
MHEEGLKTTLNLHPASGVQPWEAAYPAMARAMGIDPATKKYVPFDITNKKFATNYMDLLHHPLEKQGIDFWWLDWQQEPMKTKMPGVGPTWWLNYVHFTDQQREGKRPLLFHRWGGLGNHRYQIGFSGDTISVWESLAFQPWFTATAANVGYAYWSHDIGGHMPGAVDPELYTRWVQFGAFSPILRTHTTKNPDVGAAHLGLSRAVFLIMRESSSCAMRCSPISTPRRGALTTRAWRFCGRSITTGRKTTRPTRARASTCSATNAGGAGDGAGRQGDGPARQSKSGLPKGEWIEWPTGKHFSRAGERERSFYDRQVPVYAVKAGEAIVPMHCSDHTARRWTVLDLQAL